MADRDEVAENTGEFIREMQHRVVLNVRVVPDRDAVDVAPNDGVVPDARIISQSNVAEHNRSFCDVHAFAEFRLSAEESVQLSFELIHRWFLCRFAAKMK